MSKNTLDKVMVKIGAAFLAVLVIYSIAQIASAQTGTGGNQPEQKVVDTVVNDANNQPAYKVIKSPSNWNTNFHEWWQGGILVGAIPSNGPIVTLTVTNTTTVTSNPTNAAITNYGSFFIQAGTFTNYGSASWTNWYPVLFTTVPIVTATPLSGAMPTNNGWITNVTGSNFVYSSAPGQTNEQINWIAVGKANQ